MCARTTPAYGSGLTPLGDAGTGWRAVAFSGMSAGARRCAGRARHLMVGPSDQTEPLLHRPDDAAQRIDDGVRVSHTECFGAHERTPAMAAIGRRRSETLSAVRTWPDSPCGGSQERCVAARGSTRSTRLALRRYGIPAAPKRDHFVPPSDHARLDGAQAPTPDFGRTRTYSVDPPWWGVAIGERPPVGALMSEGLGYKPATGLVLLSGRGAVSSDGESIRSTPRRSEVRVLHRPPNPSRRACARDRHPTS